MQNLGHLDLNRLQPSWEEEMRGLHREEILKNAIASAEATGADSFFIESGAGAGKTTILARRIVSLLHAGARPDEFAILTYTKEAADELRYKIRKVQPINQMQISTIYGFARRILAAYHEDIEPYALENEEILTELLTLLENRQEVLAALRHRYNYIYMDEFQDADRVVMRLLQLLATGNPVTGDGSMLRDGALFVVGDPRQSIYQLEGQACNAYNEMRAWMLSQRSNGAQVHVVEFRLNFRTDQPVLDYINERFRPLIPGYTDMQAGRKTAFPVQEVHFLGPAADPEEEAVRVGHCILHLLEQHRTLNFRNCMVVTWDVVSRDLYTRVLEEMGIRTDDCDRTEADRSNVVRVMTVYEAKGLAGDIVCVQGEHYIADMDVYHARHLAYTAATRARHALIYASKYERTVNISQES